MGVQERTNKKQAPKPCPHRAYLLEGVNACAFSVTSNSATPWNTAPQAPLSTGFSKQEYWSGLPFLPPGDFPDPGIEPMSPTFPAMAGRFFTTQPPGKSPRGREEDKQDFPGGSVVKTSPSNAGSVSYIRSRGAKIPPTLGPKIQNIKQKQYGNKFNRDFKNKQKLFLKSMKQLHVSQW